MKTSSSFNLLSHPDRTLARHLRGCDEVSGLVLQFKPITDAFYSKALLEEMRRLLVFFHDFGKGTDFFQYKIIEATREEGTLEFQQEHEAYLADFAANKSDAIANLLHRNDRLSNHAKLGAYVVLSVFDHADPLLPVILLKVIRRHHGYLTNFSETASKKPQIALEPEWDVPELEEQLAHFNNEPYQTILADNGLTVDLTKWPAIRDKYKGALLVPMLRIRLQKSNDLRYFFLQHFLFSLLLAADKGDMMIELTADKHEFVKPNRLLPESLVDDYKTHLFARKEPRPIDLLREEAYQTVVQNVALYGHRSFFSLTMPTGLGKTFTAYRVAIQLQHQIQAQTGHTPRIIYCLPFTSIIDQNAQILADMFEYYKALGGTDLDDSWLATHHYLSGYKDHYDERELKNDEGEYLTAGWEQEVIVTTFVQLLESIFTNQNKALRKFHNLTNAVLILDEVQNIPPKYFEAVEAVFQKLALYFGTKFVFVTATQPFLFANPDDVLELTDPTLEKTQYYFDQLNRIQLDQTLLQENDYQHRELTEWLPIIQQDIEDNNEKSFLIICNTIAQSQTILQTLRSEIDLPSSAFIYLSSSLLPKIRREKIALIKQNIDLKIRQIVVSTQVVEAGVDIDLDVVYRDFAPIDSLNQSAGRCNRNGVRGQGVVKLFHTGKDRFIYDATLRDLTKQVLRKYPAIIEEKDLYNLNRDYATAVRQAVADQSDASKALIMAMQRLDLEDVNKNFKLIEEDNRSYNVFIAYNDEAKTIWQQYRNCMKLEGFARKRAIKKLTPALLQYVTRFPKKHYEPPKDKADNFIINELHWSQYYDLNTGFILPANSPITVFG